MTITEWYANYRREHPAARLAECIRALKESGEYAACSRESAARAPKQKRRAKPKPTTADQIIQAGLAALNVNYKRMIERS